jgi:predicted enzyme related to lactoylglutathione lyase
MFCLFVHDQEAAKKFYTEKLNFKIHTDAMFGENMRWLTIHPVNQPDFEISLMLAETPEEKALVGKQGADKPFFCVTVDDCGASYNQFKKDGVECLSEPKNEPWGISLAIQDLYGTIIYVVQEKK